MRNEFLGFLSVLNLGYREPKSLFSNLLKADNNNQTFKMSLAYCYGKNGKIKKAVSLYSDLISENPDSSDILVNYIYLLIAQKNHEEAQSQLLILKQKFPDTKEIEELQKQIFKSLESENKTEENAKND